MSTRNRIYEFVNALIDEGTPLRPGCLTSAYLGELLDRIGDDRSHYDAERLRLHAESFADSAHNLVAGAMAAGTRAAAESIDPYERTEDGQLVHKHTGKPITI